MKYFFNRIRFTKGDCIHGGFYWFIKTILLNIAFWMGLFCALGFLWLYAYQYSLLGIDITMIGGFCIYLFILSKIYRSRSGVPVETISWAFTGKYALFEALIAFLCAGTNAELVYNSCGRTLKTVGYFFVTFLFVYFCLRISLISVILNWKKSNSLWLLLHTIVISLFSTALITILLSRFGKMVYDLFMIFIVVPILFGIVGMHYES